MAVGEDGGLRIFPQVGRGVGQGAGGGAEVKGGKGHSGVIRLRIRSRKIVTLTWNFTELANISTR